MPFKEGVKKANEKIVGCAVADAAVDTLYAKCVETYRKIYHEGFSVGFIDSTLRSVELSRDTMINIFFR